MNRHFIQQQDMLKITQLDITWTVINVNGMPPFLQEKFEFQRGSFFPFPRSTQMALELLQIDIFQNTPKPVFECFCAPYAQI